jgi:hypothetical protein
MTAPTTVKPTKTPPKRYVKNLGKTNPIDPDNWALQARCAKSDRPDMWFPTGTVSLAEGDAATAVQECSFCPVRKQCAKEVIDSLKTAYPHRSGIWAGVRITGPTHSTIKPAESLHKSYNELREIAGLPQITFAEETALRDSK